MDRLRFNILLERHLDELATTAELEELATLLRASAEFRQVLVERTRLEVTLHDVLGTRAVANRPSVRAKVGRQKFGRRALQKSNPWITPVGIAATILIAIGAYLSWPQVNPNKADDTVARISSASSAKLVRADLSETLVVGRTLFSDDIVSTSDSGGVEVTYVDGTRVNLAAGGRMKLTTTATGKYLSVMAGQISAVVAKQPAGKPMLFSSSTAQATVVGTQLQFSVQNAETRLEVTEGLVSLKRLSDGKTVDVAAGQFATAAAGKELIVESKLKALLGLGQPLIQEDFENGKMEGWSRGAVMPGGVGNSRYAIAADTKVDAGLSTGVVFSAVQLPLSRLQAGTRDNEWIFTYQPELVLQFSYYLEREAGAIRVQGFNLEQADNFGSTLERPIIGRWTTVQLSLDEFRHNDPLERAEALKAGTHFKSLQFDTTLTAQKFLIDNVILAPTQSGAEHQIAVPPGGVR